MSETDRLTECPGSPMSLKRKPVPTPRSTLRKPSTTSKLVFVDEERNGVDKQVSKNLSRNLSLEVDKGSQGNTSNESQSPEDESLLETSNRRALTDGDDILSALEKIPGVGSLRSLESFGKTSGTPSQQPQSINRVKREASSHSLGPSSTSGVLLERQKSAPTGTFHHTRRPWQTQQNQVMRIQPQLKPVKGSTTPTSPSSASPIGEEDDDVDVDTDSSPISSGSPKTDDSLGDNADKTKIQHRPLPELPGKMSPTPESIDIVSTEQVYAALLTPEDHYCELNPQQPPPKSPGLATSVMKHNGNRHSTANCNSIKSYGSHRVVNGCVTMTGTIRRGKRKPEKTVDIHLTMTPDHLRLMERHMQTKVHDRWFCGLRRGPHVLLLSLFCLPFIWIYSTLQAFILGSMTLYNIFLYYNEERTCCHTLLSPLILLLYPIWIVPVTFILGIYAAIVQVSWYWDSWLGELRNPDKGFMNWVCQKLNVPDCAPYQVVIMSADESSSTCHTAAVDI